MIKNDKLFKVFMVSIIIVAIYLSFKFFILVGKQSSIMIYKYSEYDSLTNALAEKNKKIVELRLYKDMCKYFSFDKKEYSNAYNYAKEIEKYY